MNELKSLTLAQVSSSGEMSKMKCDTITVLLWTIQEPHPRPGRGLINHHFVLVLSLCTVGECTFCPDLGF